MEDPRLDCYRSRSPCADECKWSAQLKVRGCVLAFMWGVQTGCPMVPEHCAGIVHQHEEMAASIRLDSVLQIPAGNKGRKWPERNCLQEFPLWPHAATCRQEAKHEIDLMSPSVFLKSILGKEKLFSPDFVSPLHRSGLTLAACFNCHSMKKL